MGQEVRQRAQKARTSVCAIRDAGVQRSDLDHFEIFFAGAAFRAGPVHRHLIPRGSSRHAMLRRTLRFVIDPATNQAHPSLGFGHGYRGPCHRMQALYRAGYSPSGAVSGLLSNALFEASGSFCGHPPHESDPTLTPCPIHPKKQHLQSSPNLARQPCRA